MEQTLEIAIQPELTEIVVKSGLEKATIYAATFAPFMTKVKECSDKAATINKTDPTPLDAKLAREIRLVMVKNRTATEKKKDESKAALLAESNLIQSLNNVVINTSKLVEADLEAVEKFSERKEAERVAALKAERVELLKDYVDDATIFPLGTMTEDQFSTMLEGYKLTKRQQEEAAAKLEAERIAKEAAEKLEQERIRQENERLKAEAEAAEVARLEQERLAKIEIDRIAAEKKAADEAHAKKIAEIEAANKLAREKAEAEQAERDRLAKVESDRLAAEQIERERLVKIEADRIAAENAKLATELEEKKKSEREAAEKLAADIAAKALADEIAAKAPDKEKIIAYINGTHLPFETPSMGTDAGVKTLIDIQEKFVAFKNWATKQVEAL